MSQLNMQWGGLVLIFGGVGEDRFIIIFMFPDVPNSN
jgi:hypothetical protein